MTPSESDYGAITSRAQQILSDRFGRAVDFNEVERVSNDGRRNLLLRASIKNPAAAMPPSIIIKQTDMTPGGNQSPEWHLGRSLRDRAGVAFLSDISNMHQLVPAYFGGDNTLNFVMMADLGRDHPSLVEPLLGADPAAARTTLEAMMQHLGQLHADTFGQQERFQTMLSALHPDGAQFVTQAYPIQKYAKLFSILAEFVDLVPGFEAEAASVLTAVHSPGPFFTFVHGDPCPDNWFRLPDRLTLIDFEQAHFGHALRDAVYLRMNFPTCWCANRLPPGLVSELEAAYRTAFATSCPQVLDEAVFVTELTNCCAFWLLESFRWMVPAIREKDDTWGIATLRTRLIAHLDSFATIAQQSGHLPAMWQTAVRLHDAWQRHWPDVAPLPVYPAFQTGEAV